MANGRITVPVTTDERAALIKIAQIECRDPREQLRYMLRTEAQRRGLIGDATLGNLKGMAAAGVTGTRETTTEQP